MPNGVERPTGPIVVKWDLDNTFLWGPFSIGTLTALVLGKYKIPEVDGLTLPDAPIHEEGIKGRLHWLGENLWYSLLRIPKRSAKKAIVDIRTLAFEYDREIRVDVTSGRKPFLHKFTHWGLRHHYPQDGQERTNQLFDRVLLNSGIKSPLFKGHHTRQEKEQGNTVIYFEDDPKAGEVIRREGGLVFLSVSRLNLPAKLWLWRHRKTGIPENIIPFHNFREATAEIAARLADGRL